MSEFKLIDRSRKKEKVIFSSSTKVNRVSWSSYFLSLLKNKDTENIYISIDGNDYLYSDCFTFIVRVKGVGSFNFVFKEKEIDAESIKNEISPLKDIPSDTDENISIKFNKMFDIMNKYNPLFVFSTSQDQFYCEYDFSIFESFVFIKKVLDTNQPIKNPFKYFAKGLTSKFSWLTLLLTAACSFLVSYGSGLLMQNNKLYIVCYSVFALITLCYCFVSFQERKATRFARWFSKRDIDTYIFSVIGLILSSVIYFFVGKSTGVFLKDSFVCIGIGILSTIGLFIISSLIANVIYKKTTNKK